MIDFTEHQGPTSIDGITTIVRQSKVRFEQGVYVQQVRLLLARIEVVPLDNLGQLQREIWERNVAVLRAKFEVEYDQKWESSAKMAKFITNWYYHRLCGFKPCVSVNLHTDQKARIYYG
jgi:hypothetical protein